MLSNSGVLKSRERTSPKDKEHHILLCLEKNVESTCTAGFEKYYLINNPTPEISFEDVDTSCEFLGKPISAPFIILPMTGGTELSAKINSNLAKAAQGLNVVMSVGSQRLGLEHPSLSDTYRVRDVAPDVPLLANLGAIYLNYGYGLEECERAVKMIDADGLYLYLNPMQKIVQKGKGHNFEGLINKIAKICQHLSVPVIVKEVGFGLSAGSALLLKEAGVSLLDVSGAGGTSWVKVTRYMKNNTLSETASCFDDWGIPTADSLISVRNAVKDLPLIASGGIRSGMDMAKAIALGADYAGMAMPLLSHAIKSSDSVKEKIETVMDQLKIAMFCCGVVNLSQLKKEQCVVKR